MDPAEVQVEEDVVLHRENLLGVVLPSEYTRVSQVVGSLRAITANIETYDILPLNSAAHYGLIYEAVNRLYKKFGIAR